ncbi:MAG: phosphodiester glycosidase family protein [Clostridia bacterium]|nr:phosphodiester glycosidase family protein [Clostridia bacterium]
MKKKHPILRNLLLDAAAAGLALTVFALFHHVLPKQQESLNMQTVRPATAQVSAIQTAAAQKTETEQEADAIQETEEASRPAARMTASASISDTGRGGPSGRSGGRSSGKGSGKNNGGMGGNSKGGSALEESGETAVGTEAETVNVPIAEKFADKYTDEIIETENSYSSPDLSITVNEVNDGNITYYLADIYMRDITCFQTALADDTYGSGFRDSIAGMAALKGALLAVNGDYYGNTSEGVVIRNGTIYRANATDCDVCVLYYDGTMKVMPGSSFSVEEAVADGAWQAWTFGPALLGSSEETLTNFSSPNRIIAANPRTAIGYYEPGHYCLVVVDGRGESAGITLPQLSELFHELGCSAAYNLDGGNSSVMVWGDEVINNPSGGGRESSDALLIAEVRSNE